MATEIRLKLLQLVLDKPEMKRDDIAASQEFRNEESRTLANLLYNCKKDEQLVADEALRYTITAKGRAYLKAAGVGSALPAVGKNLRSRKLKDYEEYEEAERISDEMCRKISRPLARPAPPAEASGNGTARAIAEQLLKDSQAALDRYVESVCDHAVLTRFRAARDQAGELVESFNEDDQ